MSLLDELMDDCVLLDRTTKTDDYGGFFIYNWAEGASFSAIIDIDTSIEARTAERQGVTSVYTVTTGKELTLKHHDVFKRLSDGKIFRVTSDGDDKFTPESSTLNMREVTAEEWSLPNG